MQGQPFTFGPFLLNLDNGTLLRKGEHVAVGRRGILLLEALLKRQGEIVTKAELMNAAWPGTAVEESNLSVQIALVREGCRPRARWRGVDHYRSAHWVSLS
jgi:DNA-binding winged helix-turn-helix (wHTH) protein